MTCGGFVPLSQRRPALEFEPPGVCHRRPLVEAQSYLGSRIWKSGPDVLFTQVADPGPVVHQQGHRQAA